MLKPLRDWLRPLVQHEQRMGGGFLKFESYLDAYLSKQKMLTKAQ